MVYSLSVRGSPKGWSCGGCAGTRNSSEAQAPRSMFLQRWLQNGRQALVGAKRLGPPQVGHLTVGGGEEGALLMPQSLTQTRAYAHSVSSKSALSVVDCKLPLSLARTKRTETIRRLALISGTSPESAAMRRRSN